MKEIVIISGKGGTGKTSVLASFATLAENHVLCDADVDAADLHLIASPTHKESHEFVAGHQAMIDPDTCCKCGVCLELCRWNAITPQLTVDPLACEGCGVCVHFCPVNAIEFPENHCGEWYISDTRLGPMVHARLNAAEENSGKLVSQVRRQAKQLAEAQNRDLILIDGPPGVGCPVIASITGADAVLIVAEPTVSGWHDAERVSHLADHFKVPALICINKSDLNMDMTTKIEKFAADQNMVCLGRIPFDPIFTEAMTQAQSVIEYQADSNAGKAITALWNALCHHLNIEPATCESPTSHTE